MAGRIPQDFIDELLQRIDIVEVIDRRVPLKKAGKDYSARCPFHDERSPSFTVSPAKQFYHCFGCGAHGTVITFLMEYDRMEFRDAVRELAGMAGLEVPEEAESGESSDTREILATLTQAEQFYRQQLKQAPAAIEYLKQRGVSGQTAAAFGLGFAPPGWDNLRRQLPAGEAQDALLFKAGLLKPRDGGGGYDAFRERIMFPIRDNRGRVVGFGGRALGDSGPKYLNTPETPVFHKGRELYGLYEARQAERKLERLLVVEGYMDVVMLAEHGIRNAVATLGTATTAEHCERLFRVCPEVVFCFDGDNAGREAAWRALENTLPVMRDGRQARFLFLPQGHDPDSLVREEGAEAFSARLDQAEALSDFLFRHLGESLDTGSAEGLAALASRAAPLIERVPPGAFRTLLRQRLKERTGVEADQVAAAKKPAKSKNSTMLAGKSARRQPQLRMTPVRRAVALLLQNPAVAGAVPAEQAEQLRHSGVEGADLLHEGIQVARNRPGMTTAGLLEHWREHPHTTYLGRLAHTDLAVPEEGQAREFQDAVEHLLRQPRKARLDALLRKAQQGPLEAAEKSELRELLAREKPQ